MSRDQITEKIICPYDGCGKEGEYFATVQIEMGGITIFPSVETCNYCD